MAKNIWKRFVRPACAALAAALAVSAFVVYNGNGTVSAASQSDIEEYKNNSTVKKYQQNIADLEKKQEDLKKQISELAGDINDWQEKKAYYDELSEIYDERISVSEALYEELNTHIAQIKEDIGQKTSERDELLEQIKARMVVSYEFGGVNASYLDIFFSADGIIDFLMGIERVTSMIEYDTNMMNEYEELTSALSEEEAAATEASEELESVIAELETQKAEAETLSEESASLITNAMKDKDSLDQMIKELDEAEKAASKKLDDYIDELVKKNGTTQIVADGDFMWPLETRYTHITSRFGKREDPFRPGSGIISNHGGTDIYAPQGAKIFASKGGTVVKAEKDPSYGNYVMIDHGGGFYTIYAHCSKLLVKAGTYVEKGTLIAEVGHTGSATGNHLHFEMRRGKTRVDALDYVKIP